MQAKAAAAAAAAAAALLRRQMSEFKNQVPESQSMIPKQTSRAPMTPGGINFQKQPICHKLRAAPHQDIQSCRPVLELMEARAVDQPSNDLAKQK